MPEGAEVTDVWIAALGVCIGVTAGVVGAGPSILTVLLLQHGAGLELGGCEHQGRCSQVAAHWQCLGYEGRQHAR